MHCDPIGRQENVQIIVSTPISEVTDSSIDPNSPLSSFVDDSGNILFFIYSIINNFIMLSNKVLKKKFQSKIEDLGNRKWQIGTILAFRCAGNSQLSSAVNYSRCDDDAQWSHPIPNCMQSCIIPKLVNATILDLNPGRIKNHF